MSEQASFPMTCSFCHSWDVTFLFVFFVCLFLGFSSARVFFGVACQTLVARLALKLRLFFPKQDPVDNSLQGHMEADVPS